MIQMLAILASFNFIRTPRTSANRTVSSASQGPSKSACSPMTVSRECKYFVNLKWLLQMAENNLPEETSAARDIGRHSVPHLQEEEDLARALKAGDPDALPAIFDRYHRLVLVTALRIVRDIGEAEDLMQSIFFEIFQKAAQFDPSKGTLSK